MRYISKVLLLAVAYFIAAKLGALFTVPPYFSAVVWPGAGIGLATLVVLGQRYWVGVFLGALVVNLQHSPAIDVGSVSISFCIALGTALQAVVGCYVCRRFVRVLSTLDQASTLINLFCWGGAFASVISATVGTATLYFAGIVQGPDVAGHWFFWWLGDVTGVVAFAPAALLVLGVFDKKIEASRRRKWTATAVMLLAFFAVGIVYSLAQKLYQTEKQLNFDNKVAGVEREFELLLNAYKNVLLANDQFFIASNFVSGEEFDQFTEKFFELYPGLYALNWTPKITRENRASHVAEIRKQGYPNYQVVDRVAQGKMALAPERDLYFPIGYISPYERNKSAHGFDVYGPDPMALNVRKNLLDRGRAEDITLSTGRISIVQAENQFGLLVYHPIFDDAQRSGKKALLGYTAGVFVVPRMFETIRNRAQAVGAEFVLFDVADDGNQFLYDSRAPSAQAISQPLTEYKGLQATKNAKFGERGLQLVFIEPPTAAKQFNWVVAGASLGVLLFLALISLLLFSLTARADVVQRLVRQKTRELEEANAELEEFAYRTSHDLRSPLVSSIGLLKYIGEEVPQNNERLGRSVSVVQSSLEKLETLVGDILDLTKTKKVTEDLEEVDTQAVIEDCLQKLSFMEGCAGIRFEKCFTSESAFSTQRNKFVQIVENLVSNAIKYRDVSKESSTVRLFTYEDNGYFVFEITDNGIGIPKDKQGSLFEMFHRFHPKVAYGSGLGLYMVQKSVKSMGGEIRFEDREEGSLFRVSLPL